MSKEHTHVFDLSLGRKTLSLSALHFAQYSFTKKAIVLTRNSIVNRAARRLKSGSWRWKAFINRARPAAPVFILGTGRSGTNFLTRSLIRHPYITDLTGGTENPLVFAKSTRYAIEDRGVEDLSTLTRRYRMLIAAAAPQIFIDQTHPNIWHAETLAEAFPNARFLMPVRNPYSVVRSMMHHNGVKQWVVQWERYPVPNRFLGIRRYGVDDYKKYSLEERCAIRWAAHFVRAKALNDIFTERTLMVSYESLCNDPINTCQEIAEFLALKQPIPVPQVNSESLRKRKDLSSAASIRIKIAIEHYINQEDSELLKNPVLSQLLKQDF